MTTGAILYILVWGISSLVLGLTGAARAIAARLGNPGSYQCIVALGLAGVPVLAAASWPWPQQGRG